MVINHEPNIPGTYQAKSDKLLVAGGGIEPPTFRLWAWRATTALPRYEDNSIFKVPAIIIQPF